VREGALKNCRSILLIGTDFDIVDVFDEELGNRVEVEDGESKRLRTITAAVPHGRLKLRKENMPIHICNCRKQTKDMERHSVLFFAAKVFHTPTRKS
jgi:hypothetical protein